MKIKNYTARDMRSALNLVRDEHGPDAVLLNTRHFAGGVEVSVAMDMEGEAEALFAASRSTPVPPTAPAAGEFASVMAQTAASLPAPQAVIDPALGEELRSMRNLLESQLSLLAWRDLKRRSPATTELLKELTAMGVAPALATSLLAELPEGIDAADAQRRTLASLTRRIAITGDALLDNGGRVGFVGPNGVGKTTAIAKLAARWVMRHGPRDIALVSLDDTRFGAHEQLRVLGRLLGVESYTLEDAATLPALLTRMSRHRLVLVDTGGITPRDKQLQQRAAVLTEAARRSSMELWLTLSAGAQAGVTEDAMQAFAAFEPRAVVLTKLDEAASVGGVLSALAMSNLPLSYTSGGPRIPEDIAPARSHALIARAVFLARTADTTIGEEQLVRRFGGVAHDIR
jgi:flagellar biosynthesis protein FlhF